MRWSKLFIPTLREAPGLRLLNRAGFLRGNETLLFLGQRSAAKLCALLKGELDSLGGQQMHSNESLAAVAAAGELRSYKQLPQLWYRIQFPQVEICAVEFTQEQINDALGRVLTHCGIPFVHADSEFVALSPAGASLVARCEEAGYAAPLDYAQAIAKPPAIADPEGDFTPERFHTPNRKTIADLVEFTGLPASTQMKSLVEVCDGRPYLLLLRGDHQLSRLKLAAVLDVKETRPATPAEITQWFGASPGSLGPIGVANMPILADLTLQGRRNMICGANEDDYHLRHVTPGKDFAAVFHDLRRVEAGDMCGTFPAPIRVEPAHRLARIANIHAGFTILDKDGRESGPRVTVTDAALWVWLEAVAECNQDADGLALPRPIAPFDVVITPANFTDEAQRQAALTLYEACRSHGYEALLDDRDERPGVKFKDADLIGIPRRITIGKKLAQGLVEVVRRKPRETRDVAVGEALNALDG